MTEHFRTSRTADPSGEARRPFHSLRRSPLRHYRAVIGLIVCLALARPLAAQQTESPTLSVSGLMPSGLRNSATEAAGVLEVSVDNHTEKDRLARVLVFYKADPDVQYGKDLWVPARSRIVSYMTLGAAPKAASALAREIDFLLYDRTDGADKLILPKTEDVRRSRVVLFGKRELTTIILLGDPTSNDRLPGDEPRSPSEDEESEYFAHLLRKSQGMSVVIQRHYAKALPTSPDAYEAIDHVILASTKISGDPTGWRALRQWVRNGGTLWVTLDRVDPEEIAPFLSDVMDFQIIDRVSLNAFTLLDPDFPLTKQEAIRQVHDKPIRFVRVALPEGERPFMTADGWPAVFHRTLGRGRVVFSTLGPRAWYRPRKPGDPRPANELEAFIPVGQEQLQTAGRLLGVDRGNQPFRDEEFLDLLTPEIGYSVLNIRVVAVILGLFLLAEILLTWRLGGKKPVVAFAASSGLALLAGGALVLMSGLNQQPTPTVAIGQLVNALGGTDELTARGLIATYQPASGIITAGAENGGVREMDRSGLEGRTARRVMTDAASWHWENLAVPKGVRSASFHYAFAAKEPVQAVANWTIDGWKGKLSTGQLQGVGDAFISGPGDRKLAVGLSNDGNFQAGPGDALSDDQFLTAPSLSDRQQRRQRLLRTFVKSEEFLRTKSRTMMVAWADPAETPFRFDPKARVVGESLVMIPMRFERPAAGTRITIPGACVPYTRVMPDLLSKVRRQGDLSVDMELRFQMPYELLPFDPEKAKLSAKIIAPGRAVEFFGMADGKTVSMQKIESPQDPIRFDVDAFVPLKLDAEGGLHLRVAIGEYPKRANSDLAAKPTWTIEYLDLAVTGVVKER